MYYMCITHVAHLLLHEENKNDPAVLYGNMLKLEGCCEAGDPTVSKT